MDPESGDPQERASRDGFPSRGKVSSYLFQTLFEAVWSKLHTLFGILAPPQKQVGVENRYYYDEQDGIWKLRGGETEQERREAEAIHHHTTRGYSSGAAHDGGGRPTTAGPWRVASAAATDELPPPPMGTPGSSGAAARTLHAGAADVSAMASMAPHPVYAPQGMSFGGAPHPQATPQHLPLRAEARGAASAPLASPFGHAAAPLSSPFGHVAATAAAAAGEALPPPQVAQVTSPHFHAAFAPPPLAAQPVAVARRWGNGPSPRAAAAISGCGQGDTQS